MSEASRMKRRKKKASPPGLANMPDRYRPNPCVHPETGAPLVRGDVLIDQEVHEYQVGPPRMPTRRIYEYDEDGSAIFVRTMTAREMRAARRVYTKAMAEWVRTGGLGRVAGQVSESGWFETAAGDRVEGIMSGDRWIWTRVSVTLGSARA